MRLRLARLGAGRHRAHFEDRDHRQEPHEQEEERHEHADRADERHPVPDRRVVHPPRRGQEVAMQRRDDDHEALEPHADVDHHRDHEEAQRARAHLAEPQPLRRDDVAEDQGPVDRRIGAVHPVPDHEPFVLVGAVEAEEDFREVAVADDHPGHERHLAHVLEMPHGDEAFEAVDLPERNRQREHHREARVDGARDEVRREDRGVPARDDADREVEAHHGVDRENQRRREPREQQVDVLVALPVARRAAPAEREHAVRDLHRLQLRLVAQRREVGDEADVPEEQRHREVGRDGEHVPDQRASELRPEAHAVRVREQPVGREPRTAGVDQREDARAHDREDRHAFREAVDRRPPALFEQQQDRRDQRAGVADADPPDEVDDREAPADRDVDAPDPRALDQQPGHGHAQHAHDHEADGHDDEPGQRRVAAEDDVADLVADRGERMARLDERGGLVGRGFRIQHYQYAKA